jgi:hypothetical protein
MPCALLLPFLPCSWPPGELPPSQADPMRRTTPPAGNQLAGEPLHMSGLACHRIHAPVQSQDTPLSSHWLPASGNDSARPLGCASTSGNPQQGPRARRSPYSSTHSHSQPLAELPPSKAGPQQVTSLLGHR